MVFYPQGDSVATQTDVLAATTNGQHILGAALVGGGVQLSDIGVIIPTIPSTVPSGTMQTPAPCPTSSAGVLSPLLLTHTLNQIPVSGINATALNQVIASPASNLAFLTYTGSTAGAQLPFYVPGSNGAAGAVNYIALTGSSAITAPLAGSFSPDDKLFFVSTAGDNEIHFIDVPTLKDTQQISPNLPACAPGSDPGCRITSPGGTTVPATAIAVKPRSTT
jgi:hypothetical protein